MKDKQCYELTLKILLDQHKDRVVNSHWLREFEMEFSKRLRRGLKLANLDDLLVGASYTEEKGVVISWSHELKKVLLRE